VLGQYIEVDWFALSHISFVDIDMLVTNFTHAEAGDAEAGRIIPPAVVNLLRRGSFVRS
jgi:hypothetical protein